MDFSLFNITLAYGIFLSLLLWFVIWSRGYWWLKALVVAGTLYFSICLFSSIQDTQGFPVDKLPPPKFEVLWICVKNPDKKSGDEGAIFLWCRPLHTVKEEIYNIGGTFFLSFYQPIGDAPRSYQLPYSKLLHKQSQQIKGIIGERGSFLASLGASGGLKGAHEGSGDTTGGNGKGTGGKGIPMMGNKNGKDGGKGMGSLSQNGELMFYSLPPPLFPDKTR